MPFTFPDPQVTSEFTGANGISYAWDADDSKWQVKTFKAEEGEDFNPQLKGHVCAEFFEVVADYNAVEAKDGHCMASYPFGGDSGTKYWTKPPKDNFFVDGESYYIDEAGPFEIGQVTADKQWVTFFIKDGPQPAVGEFCTFSKTRTLCTEVAALNAADNELRQDIIELEEEIDAIAPSVEYGTWEWKNPNGDNAARPPEKGTFFLIAEGGGITDKYENATQLVISNYEFDNPNDNDPVDVHTWADANPGELIQLFDAADPDFILGKIAEVHHDGADYVRIEFVRIQASGVPNDNLDPLTNKYLTRVNVFKEPSGGEASGFVKIIGDTMEGPGPLAFKNKQSSTNYNSPPSNTSYLKFENDNKGSVQSGGIWLSGNNNILVTDLNLMVRGSVYTDSYYYAYSGSTTRKPRIRLQSSTGSLLSESTVAMSWDSTGITKIRLKNSEGGNGKVLRLDSSNVPYWSNPPMPTYTITKDSYGNYYVQ